MEPTHYVGAWREGDRGEPDAPSIHDAIRSQPHPDEPRILSYLESGYPYSYAMHLERDVLNPSKCAGTGAVRTDGVYCWPVSLIYYVRNYHVALPDEFVEHMRGNHWTVPAVEQDEGIGGRGS